MKVKTDRTTFMKMMILDYAEQLELPPKFIKPVERSEDGKFVKRSGRLSEGEYQLRVQGSGRSHCWIVEVDKDKDRGGLFFRKGWPEFLEDNNIRFLDVLVFVYKGSNKFLVQIFNPSGVKRNIALREDAVVVDTSNGGNGEGEDEPISMDRDKDDGECDDEPLNMDLYKPPIYYVDGRGECHLEVGGGHDKEELGSLKRPKEMDLDCMEVEHQKDKETHDCAAPRQKKRIKKLDFYSMKGERGLGIDGPSQKGSLSRFEEEKEKHDFTSPAKQESLEFDFSDLKGESELGTAGPSQKEGSSGFEKGNETRECGALTQTESPISSAGKGENEQCTGGKSQKESMSRIKEEKECVKESAVLPPFSSSNTHFTVTWQPNLHHYPTIPKEIAIEKDLCSKSQLVIRDHKGRIWLMKLSTGKDGTINFTDDWPKFCRGSGLKEGDACTFEFFSRRIVHAHISAARLN